MWYNKIQQLIIHLCHNVRIEAAKVFKYVFYRCSHSCFEDSFNISLFHAGGNEVPKCHSASILNVSDYALFSLITVFHAMFCTTSWNEYSFGRIKSPINTIVLLGYNTKIKYLLRKAKYLFIERLLVSSIPFCSLSTDSATPACQHNLPTSCP